MKNSLTSFYHCFITVEGRSKNSLSLFFFSIVNSIGYYYFLFFSFNVLHDFQSTMAHKGHAANKKRSLQTKNMLCKQKKIAASKKHALQTKNDRCKQKTCAANKKRSLQTKNMRCKQKTIPANKKHALQTKNAVAIWPV